MVFTIKQLNQFDYSDYQGIVEYLDTNLIPGDVKDVPRYEEKFQDFEYREDDHLYYGPLNRIVARDEADKEYMLRIIYDAHPAHGIGQFYEIVSANVININKRRCTEFLKKQIDYQLTVQPRKTIQKFHRKKFELD